MVGLLPLCIPSMFPRPVSEESIIWEGWCNEGSLSNRRWIVITSDAILLFPRFCQRSRPEAFLRLSSLRVRTVGTEGLSLSTPTCGWAFFRGMNFFSGGFWMKEKLKKLRQERRATAGGDGGGKRSTKLQIGEGGSGAALNSAKTTETGEKKGLENSLKKMGEMRRNFSRVGRGEDTKIRSNNNNNSSSRTRANSTSTIDATATTTTPITTTITTPITTTASVLPFPIIPGYYDKTSAVSFLSSSDSSTRRSYTKEEEEDVFVDFCPNSSSSNPYCRYEWYISCGSSSFRDFVKYILETAKYQTVGFHETFLIIIDAHIRRCKRALDLEKSGFLNSGDFIDFEFPDFSFPHLTSTSFPSTSGKVEAAAAVKTSKSDVPTANARRGNRGGGGGGGGGIHFSVDYLSSLLELLKCQRQRILEALRLKRIKKVENLSSCFSSFHFWRRRRRQTISINTSTSAIAAVSPTSSSPSSSSSSDALLPRLPQPSPSSLSSSSSSSSSFSRISEELQPQHCWSCRCFWSSLRRMFSSSRRTGGGGRERNSSRFCGCCRGRIRRSEGFGRDVEERRNDDEIGLRRKRRFCRFCCWRGRRRCRRRRGGGGRFSSFLFEKIFVSMNLKRHRVRRRIRLYEEYHLLRTSLLKRKRGRFCRSEDGRRTEIIDRDYRGEVVGSDDDDDDGKGKRREDKEEEKVEIEAEVTKEEEYSVTSVISSSVPNLYLLEIDKAARHHHPFFSRLPQVTALELVESFENISHFSTSLHHQFLFPLGSSIKSSFTCIEDEEISRRRGIMPIECAICLGEFWSRDMCTCFPICSHVFHYTCLVGWAQWQNRNRYEKGRNWRILGGGGGSREMSGRRRQAVRSPGGGGGGRRGEESGGGVGRRRSEEEEEEDEGERRQEGWSDNNEVNERECDEMRRRSSDMEEEEEEEVRRNENEEEEVVELLPLLNLDDEDFEDDHFLDALEGILKESWEEKKTTRIDKREEERGRMRREGRGEEDEVLFQCSEEENDYLEESDDEEESGEEEDDVEDEGERKFEVRCPMCQRTFLEDME